MTNEKMKKLRLEKDNHRCVRCSSGKNLIVHHLTYENEGNEKIDDLITLCSICHPKIHNFLKSKSNIQIEIDRDDYIIFYNSIKDYLKNKNYIYLEFLDGEIETEKILRMYFSREQKRRYIKIINFKDYKKVYSKKMVLFKCKEYTTRDIVLDGTTMEIKLESIFPSP